MDRKYKQPGWLFYPTWVAFSTLAIPLAFGSTFVILTLATRWIGGWIVIGGHKRITEDYLFMFVFPPLIWLFTSGLQYALLRRYLPKMGGWFLLTGAGWLLAVATLFLMSFAFAKYFAITPFNAFILSIIGAAIGLTQWLLLHKRIQHACWWIIASALGWSMIALVDMPFTGTFDILAIGFFPAITTAFAWWFIFKKALLPKHKQALIS